MAQVQGEEVNGREAVRQGAPGLRAAPGNAARLAPWKRGLTIRSRTSSLPAASSIARGASPCFAPWLRRFRRRCARRTEDDVPILVAAHLRWHNLPLQIRVGADPVLTALPWEKEPHLELLPGASDGSDAASLSRAFAGVAESGTLVLLSAAQSDHAELLARHAYCACPRGPYRGRLRGRLAAHPRAAPAGNAAAHGELRDRPLPLGRHRADPDPRRARPPRAAYPGGGIATAALWTRPPAPLSSAKNRQTASRIRETPGSSGASEWLFFSSARFRSISARSPR